LISVITPAARRAGETSHGVLFNVQRTVKTLELLHFQNRQQRGIKSRFRFDTVLRKNRGFGTDFDNRNKTSQVCVRENGKTSAHLKSVFKMSTVCSKSNASSKTWTPLPDHFIEMFPLFDQARPQLLDVTNLVAVHTLLQLLPNLVLHSVKARTVGLPQSWSDELWCFMSKQMHCLMCSVNWTPECLTAVCIVTGNESTRERKFHL